MLPSQSKTLCPAFLRLKIHPLLSTTTNHSSTTPPHHRRLQSTTTTTTNPSPSSPLTATSSSTTTTPPPLTWNAYLPLRKTRRRYNLIASLTSSILTTGAGVSVLSQQNLDTFTFFGLDPFVMLGLATAGTGAAGWLFGPSVGNRVFSVVYRRLGDQIGEKEKDFYQRIKRNRVDPAGASSANPVPDYYGEKIGSVQEYRNWMKDQRAFNKKRQNFL